MSDWTVEDWVFAYFSEDGYWYPAEIVEVDGDSYKVCYDDGSEEWLDADSLEDYDASPGEEGAEAWWDEDECFYEVTILEVNDEQVKVEYEDGVTEWTDLSYLRFAG